MLKHTKHTEAIPLLPRSSDEEIVLHRSEWDENEFKRIIRSMNLKVTGQRLLILKAISEGRVHVTAQELFEKVVKLDSSIGFATVYRFLRSLAENKHVNEVRMGGFPARYELMSKRHHDHLTCTSCGKICEFENKTIEKLQDKVAEQFGFKLTHHVLELYGLCHSCQSKQI